MADPSEPPRTVAQAKKLVEDLEQESAAIDQKWLAAQQKYESAEKSLKAKKRDLGAQEKKVAELRKAVGAIALAQYQSRGVDTTTKLMVSSSPDALLKDLSLQERMNDRQRVVLQDYQIQLGNLADLQRSAEVDSATMKQATADMAKARKDSEAKLAEAERTLERLTAEEQARIEAARRAEAERARQAAEDEQNEQNEQNEQSDDTGGNNDNGNQNRDNSNSRNQDRSKSNDNQDKGPTAPVSGRAAAAVASAKSKLGSPYVMGGTGPSYDCSGLTMTSWAAAGVSIPRTSQAQYSGTKRISRDELQPGDLVFYYGGISHVAMYVGNGQIIHAPNSRSVVKYDSISSMPIVGYGRV